MTAPIPAIEPDLVTVVMPARNEREWIGEQLTALGRQSYPGDWELVVVDDGSTDGTADVVRELIDELPRVRIVSPRVRGLNAARNRGAEVADGALLAYCDADDVVSVGWLQALVEAAPEAHIVGGPLEHLLLNPGAMLRHWVPQQVPSALSQHSKFLEFAPGGNCAIWTVVARELGWNEIFRFGGSDLDFCWRAKLSGYTLGFAPQAVVHRRFPDDPISLARTHFRYGSAEPMLYRHFRESGMSRTSRADVVAAWRRLLGELPGAVRGSEVRGDWLRRFGLRAGRVAGSLRHRTLYL